MRNLRPSLAPIAKTLALTLALVAALGCAIQKAQSAFDQGRYEEALEQYRMMLRKDPNNVKAKIGYRRTAPLAAESHLRKGQEALKIGREAEGRKEVGTAVVLDPSNAVAVDLMARLEAAAEKRAKAEEEETVADAKAKAEARPVLPINPRSLEGMDLNFSRKTSLKEILSQLSRNSGVNIILHSSVSAQDPMISVDLRGLTFQRVLDTLMLQSDLFYKVLDPNTIMIFKKTPQNLNDFENKLIQTFFLSNAEVDSVRQIFNAIMPQMRVFMDKRLNAITVQAKTSDLAIAQRIVGQLDKAKPEVMVYLELLEVNSSASEQVGLIPTVSPLDTTAPGLYRVGATLANNSGGMNVNTGGMRISKAQLQFMFAPLALDMLRTNGDGKLLASPNVRVVSGESGEVNIGQKISTTQSQLGSSLPTSATTAAAAAAASGNLGNLSALATPQTSYSYQDVGVKIKVTPRVHFNNDITIVLESEVTNILGSSTPGRPDMGQRVIKTSARLRDGETAIFGGLLREDETKKLQGVWGITDLPILGKLFGHNDSNKSRVDVILSLRAVVVRKPNLGEDDFEPFDPDQSVNTVKPFTPKPEKKPMPSGLQQEITMAPVPKVPRPKETQDAPTDAAKDPSQDPAKDVAKAGPSPESTPLVFFMSPLTTEAQKGQRVSIDLQASGGQGVTGGSMSLQVDPRLKLIAVTPGDFLTGEAGTLQQTVGTGGALTLTFTRPKGMTDTGTLATLELEAVDLGKASVLIQDGKYQVGANPVPARYSNALVTIQ